MLAKRLIIFIITTLVGYSASAQLIFTPERFDFGTLEEMGGKRSCTFRATNQGKKPVVLVDIVTTCGCTVPTFSRKPILPNQSTEIIVTYDPQGRPGSFDRKLHIYGPNHERLGVISITGNVTPRPRTIEERYPIEVGEGVRLNHTHCAFTYIYVGRSIASALSIINTSDKPRTIHLEATQASGLLDLEYPTTLQPGEQSAINFRYDLPTEQPRYGTINDVLAVEIDGKRSEKVLLAHGIAIDPPHKATKGSAPKIEVSEIILKFGAVKHAKSPHTRSLTIHNAGSSELILQAAECKTPFTCEFPVGARLAPGESLTGHVTLTPRAEEYGFVTGQLLLVTNDPEHPARRIRINGTIED